MSIGVKVDLGRRMWCIFESAESLETNSLNIRILILTMTTMTMKHDILELLTSPQTVKQIADKIGSTADSIRKQILRLKKEGSIKATGQQGRAVLYIKMNYDNHDIKHDKPMKHDTNHDIKHDKQIISLKGMKDDDLRSLFTKVYGMSNREYSKVKKNEILLYAQKFFDENEIVE